MGELVIKGLTLAEYAAFSAEAGMLRQKWEQSEGTLDIEADMLRILAKYRQNPRDSMDETGKLNYHACGLIYEWHETINNDPEMMVRFSQLSGEFIQKAMYGVPGSSDEPSIEGITLENYARACAMLAGVPENQMPAMIMSLGFRDMDHWARVRDGFNAAMASDLTLKTTTLYGQYYAKYNPAHMAASTQYAVDVVTEYKEEGEERDKLQQTAIREIATMATQGKTTSVLDYLKSTFPEDADDMDVMDWYVDKALDMLADAGNRDAAKALLGVRYDIRGETEPKAEWVENELDMLF